jgi:HlyD family secretion protein
MHINKKFTWIGGSAALLALLAWWTFRPTPIDVEVASVVRGSFVKTIDDDGRTRAREKYLISAPLSGTLQRIEIHAGDRVAADQVVATILPQVPSLLDERTREELAARVGAADAAKLRAAARVQQANVSLTQARSELERTRRLAASQLASAAKLEQDTLLVDVRTKELEAARAEVHVSEHELDVAKAALRESGGDSRRASVSGSKVWRVRSPIAGQVLRVNQESETVVAIGQPIMEIGNAAELEVVVDVLTTDAVEVHPGSAVWFDRWGGQQRVDGKVRFVEPSAFTKLSALGVEEQRVNVIVDITSSQSDWQKVGDGYKVDARIVVNNAVDVLKAPSSALFRDQDAAANEWFAYVIDGGRVRKRAVKLGNRNADEVIVSDGLSETDQVVVYPSESLQDGAMIRVVRR